MTKGFEASEGEELGTKLTYLGNKVRNANAGYWAVEGAKGRARLRGWMYV